jgi:hypothetical protein
MDIESHHMTRVATVFDVWATYDQNWRKPHYPSYPVRTMKVGSALALEGAERIVRETVRLDKEDELGPGLHSLRITEIPVGEYAPDWHSFSEYLYDRGGLLLDSRTTPYNGVFPGRSADQLRFKQGDLCEVLDGDRVYLGFVVEVPPSEEDAARINHDWIHLDATDDSYVVLPDPHYINHDHVDSLRIFKPMHRIAAQTLKRLQKAYAEYRAFPARMEAADSAATARLREAIEGLGWSAEIEAPRWEDDTFKLMLKGVPGFPEGLDLQIRQKKAWDHMDRILLSFRRLAGKPAEGPGYRLKKIVPPPPLRRILASESEDKYCL